MINMIVIWLTIVIYTILLLFIVIFIPFMIYKEKANQKKFKTRLIELIKSNNDLSIVDIKAMSNGVNISEFAARKIIDQLYYADKINLNSIRNLREFIQKEEPFDGCSNELKPTLIGINEILINHGSESQKHLLNPIIPELKELNQIKHEHKKMKKQNYIAYVIAIVSFIIGSISFFYTVKAPSSKDIANAVVERINAEKQ